MQIQRPQFLTQRAPTRAPARWFARMFGLAAIAHLVGNPVGWRSVEFGGSAWLIGVSGALATLSVLLLLRPSSTLLVLTACAVLGSLFFELPVTGNHWAVMGFVALAVLLAHLTADPWLWLSVTGRWILLVFYSFAAFAKLNSGFFDPAVSCGVFYANQSLAAVRLPSFEAQSPWGTLAIWGPVLTELSVPALLSFTRTRFAGVLVALVFHAAISLDLSQHFFDFTGVLLMLLCLFLPESTTGDLETRWSRPSRIQDAGVSATVVILAASLTPPSFAPGFAAVRWLPFVVWVPLVAWLIVRVARTGPGPVPLPMKLSATRSALAALMLVAAVIANGLAPYLELKTSLGFNMYANLSTVAGKSNHLIVTRTLHLSTVQDSLVEVVDSPNEELEVYATQGYLLPERNLLDYLARDPDATVTVEDANGQRTLTGADGRRLPMLVRKFLTFRAVDVRQPPRCQTAWFPAY